MSNKEVLKNILFQLDRAEYAYELYQNNQVYLHASNIYKANSVIIEIINSHGGSFSGIIRTELLHLLVHLDVWMEQFHHLESKLNPGLETKFIFERLKDTMPFPKSVRNLILNELTQ